MTHISKLKISDLKSSKLTVIAGLNEQYEYRSSKYKTYDMITNAIFYRSYVKY